MTFRSWRALGLRLAWAAVLGLVGTSLAIDGARARPLGWGLVSAALTYAVLASRMKMAIDDDGVVVRNLRTTDRWGWADVECIGSSIQSLPLTRSQRYGLLHVLGDGRRVLAWSTIWLMPQEVERVIDRIKSATGREDIVSTVDLSLFPQPSKSDHGN